MLNQSVIASFQPISGVHIGIDKVALGIPLVVNGNKNYWMKFHLEKEILNSIHDLQIKMISKSGNSATIGRYFNATGNRRILTIVAGTAWGNPYCQFVFNPNRLSAADWQTIEEILCFCFNYGLSDLLEKGIIRKLELSADFKNISPSDSVILASRIKSGATNFKGTMYCGNRNSPLSVAMYDKAKQLAALEGISLPHALTRIEARLVLPKQTLLGIAEGKIRNPWERIFHISPNALKKVCSKFFSEAKTSANKIVEFGLPYVLSGLTTKDRKEFLRLLCVHAHPDYNPQRIWEAQTQMIRRFFPQFGGVKFCL